MDQATRKHTKLIHEGKYAAEADVEFHYDERWSPTMSADDVKKLDLVRLALRRGDLAEAGKYARLFEIKPVSV